MRPLHTIAREIRTAWPRPYFGAVPYMQAMSAMSDLHSMYGADSADSIVRYFLANAGTWRGPDARRIKTELNAMLRERSR